MKNLNKFLVENKKIMMVVPIVLVAIVVFSYFSFTSKDNAVASKKMNADVSLPEANTSDVPDNKLETFKEYDNFSTAQNKERAKGMDMDIDNDPMGTSSKTVGKKNTPDGSVYEQPSDELTAKLDAMITKMDENKKNKKSSNNSQNVGTQATYSNTKKVNSKPIVEIETEAEKFKRESKENFDGFFGKKEPVSKTGTAQASDDKIYAVVYKDQIIKNQDRVTLILTKDAVINGKIYKANTLIYAIANFSKNRVNLNITNVNQERVKLVAHDAQDSNPGIYVEGESLVKEVASDLEDAQVNDVDLNGVPLGNTVKKIFKKKKKEPRVQLLNNYKLILKSDK